MIPSNGWRTSPCGWSVPRKRDINLGKDKVWLSRTVRIKDSRLQVDTYQLPRLARRWNEDRQMEDGLLCAIYRGGRQSLLWARATEEGEWQVEGLTATPLASLAAVSQAVSVRDEEVGEYVQHLLIQAPQRRFRKGGVITLAEMHKWVSSKAHKDFQKEHGALPVDSDSDSDSSPSSSRTSHSAKGKGLNLRNMHAHCMHIAQIALM